MPRNTKLQTNFTKGELSPRLEGRPDIAAFFNGCRILENFIVYPQGGAQSRSGTKFVQETKDSTKKSRLVPFKFNVDQAYMLEVGEGYIRVFKDAAPVVFSGSVAPPSIQSRFKGISSGTTHHLHLPLAIGVGDLLIAIITFSNDGQTVTWPADWTPIGSEDNTNMQTEVAYKIADGTESGSIDVGTGSTLSSAYITMRVTGHDPAQAPEVSSVDGGAVSVSPNPPSLNPSGWGSDRNLWIAVAGVGAITFAGEPFTAIPTDYSVLYSTRNLNACALGVAHRQLLSNVENPGNFTLKGAARWVGMTIAVKPAVVTNLPMEIPTDFLEADLFTIRHRQSADVMFAAHPSYPQQKLSRLGDTLWTFQPANFRPPPTVEADTEFPAVLTPAASSGLNIQFDADASIFLASDVGRMIVFGTSKAIITVRDSATRVHADIIDDFPDTEDIPAGDWKLRGSPQATLNPNKGRPVNAKTTLTAGTPAFRDEDVGKYVKIYGGVVKITEITDSTHAQGQILSIMSESGSSNPGTALAGAWTLEVSAWSEDMGYPGVIEFFDGRLGFSASPSQPTTFWLSRSNDYENIAVGSLADDAIQYTIASREVNRIQWMAAYGDLLLGDAKNEHVVKGKGADEPLGGDVLPQVRAQSAEGSAAIDALPLTDGLAFINAALRKIFMASYDVAGDRFRPTDITKLAEHITAPSLAIHPMVYAQNESSSVYVVRSDGQLLVLTIDSEEKVLAWSRFVTEGEIESVAAIPHPDGGKDQVWVIVKRNIDGVDRRHIEYFDDAMQTDCGVLYSGVPVTELSGLSHLEGKTVDIIVDGDYIGQSVVSGGAVSFAAGSEVQVGLHYEATLETMRPSIQNQMSEGFKRRWVSAFVRMQDTRHITIDGNVVDNGAPFTGDKQVDDDEWTTDGSVEVKRIQPYKAIILAIFGDVEFAEVMGE